LVIPSRKLGMAWARPTRFNLDEGCVSIVAHAPLLFLARQPSGAWSTQSRNRQAPARALPGDYLGEQFE
jgi:hypothetical protein